MTATNMTGIIIAVIILSALGIKGFIKPVYAIWLLLCIIAVPIGIRTILSVYPYKGQVITAALNIVVYGFIFVRILTEMIKPKNLNGLRRLVFILWLVMLALMFFSVNEHIWPVWYAIVFGSFYLTDFEKDTEKNILQSIPDGIILGFFVIQGIALLFRPYDLVRYSGLYVNANLNALFYLMSYSAFLCKWFFLKKKEKYTVLRAVLCLFAASMYGFCIYTGSKSSILAMIAVTVLFSVLMLRCCKNKVVSFIRCWLMLGFIGMISVPIIYGAIRYMPTLHLHPLYFEGEYSINRVQPGEPRDSMKYITFEDAMRTNVGRVFYKIPKLKDYFDLFIPLTVHAAEPEDVKETEFLFSQEEEKDGIDPIELRKRIQTYYFERLNILGHTNDYEVAQLTSHSNAPHAHNVFIQMAFLYGVPSGILFVLMVLSFIPGCIGLMKKGEDDRVCLISCFVLSFVVFGLFEIDWMCGQLPFTMLFILFRDVVRKNSVDNHMQYNC